MGMRQTPQASSVSQDRRTVSRGPSSPAVRPPARLPAAMAVWLRPYQVSPSPKVCLMSTGILTTSSALSSRLKALTRAMYFRISGRSCRRKVPLSARSALAVCQTLAPVCLGVWGIWMNSSITAEAKKQAEAPARTGVTPKAP